MEKENREKILESARNEYNVWSITQEQLQEVYFHNFIKPNQ